MNSLHTQMDKHGRILIPARIRHFLNYRPGDHFVIKATDNELRVLSLQDAIKSAQNLFQQKNKIKNKSVVEDFLQNRRNEAKVEDSKFN